MEEALEQIISMSQRFGNISPRFSDTLSQAYILKGLLAFVNSDNRGEAKRFFIKAIEAYPNARLSDDLATPELRSIFDDAKRSARPSNNYNNYGQQQQAPNNPYGQQQQNNPYGQQQPNNPYGQQRQNNPYGQQRQNNPYGQQQPNNPYGQQQPNNPYGQQRPNNPYGQQRPNNPYGQQRPNDPYGQQRPNNPYGQQRRHLPAIHMDNSDRIIRMDSSNQPLIIHMDNSSLMGLKYLILHQLSYQVGDLSMLELGFLHT